MFPGVVRFLSTADIGDAEQSCLKSVLPDRKSIRGPKSRNE